MKKMTLLGDITPAEFLRDYWHKKPLLIRQALPGFQAFLPRDDLFALAAQDDVESRLVTRLDGQWKMVSGPQAVLPAPTQPEIFLPAPLVFSDTAIKVPVASFQSER